MKAIIMTAPGATEVLQLVDLPLPELPDPHYVRVRLKAAGVNPIDTKIRKSALYYPDRLPAILGCDGAGVVETVGEQATRFKPGDEVFFFNGGIGGEPGNYAEYTTLHEDYVAAKPTELSFAEAAALPLALITAWEALFDRAGLKEGQSVLVHAAAGGVGHLAVQLARHAGARIAGTVRGDEKTALARSLGVELPIDYHREDVAPKILEWTRGKGVDVVLDTVGGETFCCSFAATAVYGKVVTLLQTDCPAEKHKLARLRNLSLIYELMLAPLYLGLHEARLHQRHILEEGARLAVQGKLSVIVSRVMPLADAALAHRQIEEGHTTGKLVLEID